jgi:hypothetical protein
MTKFGRDVDLLTRWRLQSVMSIFGSSRRSIWVRLVLSGAAAYFLEAFCFFSTSASCHAATSLTACACASSKMPSSLRKSSMRELQSAGGFAEETLRWLGLEPRRDTAPAATPTERTELTALARAFVRDRRKGEAEAARGEFVTLTDLLHDLERNRRKRSTKTARKVPR